MFYFVTLNFIKAQLSSPSYGDPDTGPSEIIQTIAGTSGVSGQLDNVLAYKATMNGSRSVTIDASGNYYIADKNNNIIRRVDGISGKITTIAGFYNNGTGGYNQGNLTTMTATLALLNSPTSVVIDNAGRYLYIADSGNFIIRKVDLISNPQTITTIVGIHGQNGFDSIVNGNGIAKYMLLGKLGYCLALDTISGNLYISDPANGRVRMVDTLGYISTMAGGGTFHPYSNAPSFSFVADSVNIIPKGIAFAGGNLYLTSNHNLYIVNGGTINLVAGNDTIRNNGYGDGGGAISAGFNTPTDIAVDASGIIIVVDNADNRIRIILPIGIFTLYGGYTGSYQDGVAPFLLKMQENIGGMCFDNCGNLLISSYTSHCIRKMYYNNIGVIEHPVLGIINNVNVNITGNSNESVTSQGYYYWTPSSGGSYVKLTPYKNNDTSKSNGVTGFDIAMIQSVILGKTSFLDTTNPQLSYLKYFAADVTGDGKITALDIVYIKRLILGIDTTFINSFDKTKRLWAFVDKNATFIDSTNPFNTCNTCSNLDSFREAFSIIKWINSSTKGVDFYGIKLGDVNYDMNINVDKKAPVTLYYDNIDVTNVAVGDNITIPIKIKNFKNIVTTQYTLNFNTDNLQYISVQNTDNQLDFNDQQAGQGKISFAWLDATVNGTTLPDGTVLFNLVFKKQQKISSQDIQLSSDITTVESTNSKFENVSFIKQAGLILDSSRDVVNTTIPPINTTSTNVCLGTATVFTDYYPGADWSTANSAIATVDSNGNVTAVGVGTTTINYSVTDSAGTQSVSASITVNGLPIATISSVSNLCTNSSITLSGTIANGVWSSNAASIATVDESFGTVTGVSAGLAVIIYTVTDSNGCVASAIDSITVHALPNATITGASVLCMNSPVTFTDYTTGGIWNSNNTSIATIGLTSGIVNEVRTGKDTITYTVTDANGCTSVGTKIITIDTIPTATVFANPNPACAGQTITFNANSISTAATFTWTGSGATPVPNNGATVQCINATGGTKTFTVTATNSCGVTTKALSVQVNTLPSTPTISPSGSGNVITLAPCGTQELKSSASSGDQWYMDGTAISGATGQYYTGSVGHSYSVTTSNSNGCTSNMSVIKTLQASTFTMSPNPAHTSVSVQGINVAEIDIVNNVGTTVISKIVTAGSGSSNTSISVGSLVAGSYTVVVKYNTGCSQSQTLIKY